MSEEHSKATRVFLPAPRFTAPPRVMVRITCVQLSALKRSSALGKTKLELRAEKLHASAAEKITNDNMRQHVQILALCFIPVSLSIIATLVFVNDKGKQEEVFRRVTRCSPVANDSR